MRLSDRCGNRGLSTLSAHSNIEVDRAIGAGFLADFDLLALVALILIDVRILQGSPTASFTLYEIFIWGYGVPIIIGRMLSTRQLCSPLCLSFIYAISAYLLWVLITSMAALMFRGHSDVLQQGKNILPTLPLVYFIFIRVKRPETVARILNLYILYCFLDCALALVQLKSGGPYVRPVIDNNEYKLDYEGDPVGTMVLGFSSTPNELALTVLPGVMFSVVKMVHEVRQYQLPRLVTLACCVVTGTVLFLAQSRGAVIWALFGLAVVCGPTRISHSFWLKLTLVGAVIAALVFYGLNIVPVDSTVEVRVLLWETSFDALTNDIYTALLGDGIEYVTATSWHIANWEFPGAHNGWIDQAVFFGVPALLLYLAIWRTFFKIVDAAAVPPYSSVLLDGIRASVVSYMGLYFFEPVANAVLPVSILFLLMACGIALANTSRLPIECKS